MDVKVCKVCGAEKPLSEFGWIKDGRHPAGGYSTARCKACLRAYHGEWRRTPKGRALVVRNQRKRTLAKFGVDVEQYDAAMARQKGVCAICERPCRDTNGKELAIDHDHATQRFRGLLCRRCNAALGMFDDDPERLSRAARYLRGTLYR